MQESLQLRPNHTWKAKPGYAICVLDRGAVHFAYPNDWILKEDKQGYLSFFDIEPPKDNCNFSISVFHTPPADWSELPLRILVDHASPAEDDDPGTTRGEIVEQKQAGFEIAWFEKMRWEEDGGTPREVCSRVLLARGAAVHSLITFNVWKDRWDRFAHVWRDLVDSLVLEWYVQDPTRGPVKQ